MSHQLHDSYLGHIVQIPTIHAQSLPRANHNIIVCILWGNNTIWALSPRLELVTQYNTPSCILNPHSFSCTVPSLAHTSSKSESSCCQFFSCTRHTSINSPLSSISSLSRTCPSVTSQGKSSIPGQSLPNNISWLNPGMTSTFIST